MSLKEIIAMLQAHLKELEAATDIGVVEEYTGRRLRYPEDDAEVSKWEDAIETLQSIAPAADGGIVVTLHREPDDRDDAIWHVRVMAEGIDNQQADYESEPQALLNWLTTTIALVMGRVALQQERKETT